MSSYILPFTYLKKVIISSLSPFFPQEWKIVKYRNTTTLCFWSCLLFGRCFSCSCNSRLGFKVEEKTETPVTGPGTWPVTLSAYWLDGEQGSVPGPQRHPCLLYLNTCSFFNCFARGGVVSRPLTLSWPLFTGHAWSAFKKKLVAIAKHPSIQEICEWLLCARRSLGIGHTPVNKAVTWHPCPQEAYILRVYTGVQAPAPTTNTQEEFGKGDHRVRIPDSVLLKSAGGNCIWKLQMMYQICIYYLCSFLPFHPFKQIKKIMLTSTAVYQFISRHKTRPQKNFGNRRERSLILPEDIWNKNPSKMKKPWKIWFCRAKRLYLFWNMFKIQKYGGNWEY